MKKLILLIISVITICWYSIDFKGYKLYSDYEKSNCLTKDEVIKFDISRPYNPKSCYYTKSDYIIKRTKSYIPLIYNKTILHKEKNLYSRSM